MEASDAYLGDMLVSLGALTASDLSEARNISRSLKQPMIKVLVQSGFMDEQDLNEAVEAVRLVEPGMLPENIARAAYTRAKQKGITFSQALREINVLHPEPLTPTTQPVYVAHAPQPQLSAPNSQQRVPMPKQQTWTGHTMNTETTDSILCDLISDSCIVTAEVAQAALKAAAERQVTLEQALLSSGQITEGACGTITQLRELLDAKTIQPTVAQEILRKVVARNITVGRALAEVGLMRTSPSVHIRLGEILIMAGFIKDTQLEEALKLATWNDNLIGKMLVVCGFTTAEIVTNALQCQFLIRDGLLKVEQAVIALHYCERCRTTIDDALAEIANAA